jgi:hypothetical protein
MNYANYYILKIFVYTYKLKMEYSDYIIEKLGKPLSSKNIDTTLLYLIRYDKLITKFKLNNWAGNRSPDMKRIPAICNMLYRQDYVDGVIYLAYYDEKTLVCYDGMHRLTALKEVYTKTKKQMYHNIFINILPRYDDVFIKQKIIELNEGRPIPFGIEPGTNNFKKVYEIAGIICKKYDKMFVGTKNPRLPNEFRDNFVEKLGKIISELNLNDQSIENIIKLIENYNSYLIKNQTQLRKLTTTQLKKCKENNCFIFALKNWENILIEYFNRGIITL